VHSREIRCAFLSEQHIQLDVPLQQVRGRAGDDYLPLVHDGHVVGETFELRELVRGNDDGPSLALHETQQLREQHLAGEGVESDRRLIEQQHLRVPGQSQKE
jgi:hypothetical protein